MNIQLSDHFTYKRLLRFTFPTIIMMIFTSIYGVVDGIFVANFVGSSALSSINIIYPLIMIVGAFGFMLGTGGSAQVAKTLGEGKKEKASEYFSLIIYTIIAVSIILSVVCIIFIRPIATLFGANENLIGDCVIYGTVLLCGMVAFMLQVSFQSFFVVAEKPGMGLILTVASGITNMILDFVFIFLLKWGVFGAALATVCGYMVGGIIPLIYFICSSKSRLKLVKTSFYLKMLLHSCANGSSEMMTNISSSIVGVLYNRELMKLMGEDGVAAFSVIMYVNFIFVAAFIGYAIGSAPIISYNYGAKNHDELKSIYKKSLIILSAGAVMMFGAGEIFSRPISSIFVGYDPALLKLTLKAFRVFAISFLFCGVNIFASSFFTALCNGTVSAVISFVRTLLLQGGTVLIMPMVFGAESIWAAIPATEALAIIVSFIFFSAYKPKYNY